MSPSVTAARRLANRTGLAVLSVDYRGPPEHRFPAAPDDVDAQLRDPQTTLALIRLDAVVGVRGTVEADDDVRVVVFRAAGERALSAGADVITSSMPVGITRPCPAPTMPKPSTASGRMSSGSRGTATSSSSAPTAG